jgi:branched-chain amino acid transport system ATP-binding protein
MTPLTSGYALEVTDLTKAFGGLVVTQGVSLAIRPGERRLIIGPNGAGKTTLFNQINGDMRPSSGQIKLFGTDVATEARRVLDTVGLLHLAAHPVSDIAYGEKRRVELAMALAQKPRVLLLDEPLAGLSNTERSTVKSLIASIPQETTMIMIEHDMDTALDLAETVTLLNYGRVIVDGDRDAVIADERTREVYLGV